MNIADFRRQRLKEANTAGGRFVRADFHVHLPGSSDYEYKGADAFEQMAKSLSGAKIEIAVILKHEEFPTSDELTKLQKLCPTTKLIPGAEINVFVDALFKKVSKDHFFHAIVAADPESNWPYLLVKAKERLSYRGNAYPSGFDSSIGDVAKFFRDENALFIPAHLHQSKAPQNSRSIDDIYEDDTFLGLVRSGTFTALEVRELNTARFFDGTKTTTDGDPIPNAICVRSSDAHSHQQLTDRNRHTWLQLEKPDFGELQAALSFKHRVSLEEPSSSYNHVVGIHIVGSFLPDVWVEFNPSMNCLIGSKGAGKTSVLECLRFVLNTHVPPERRESVGAHLHHILGAAGYVECLVKRANGSEAIIVRRADSSTRIKVIEHNGDSREIDSSQSLDFEVAILGWHEIEAVADHAAARIKLVDRLQGEDDIRSKYLAIDGHIEAARDLLPTLQRSVKRLDESIRELWSLQKKRQTLQKLSQGALLDLQTKYERHLECEQKLKTLKTQVQRAHQQMTRTGTTAYRFDTLTLPSDTNTPRAVSDAQSASDASIQTLQTTRAASIKALQEANDAAVRHIDDQISSVRTAFAEFRQSEYEPKVKDLQPEDRDVLSRQIQIIEETKNLPEVESQCRLTQSEVHSLAEQLYSLCDSICIARDDICRIRLENVQSINTDIPTVQLGFKRSANHSRRDDFQRSYSEDAGSFFGFLDGYNGNDSYQKLRTLFERLKSVQITESSWKIDKLLWDTRFVELLHVIDDDDVEIQLKVGQAGFVSIQNLSAGQRCTAVFPLLLRNTRGPLVVDQPEDNLDNRYIADVIAPDLLNKKRKQQFIATSHNANLVVLTDSDLVMHADSDGKQGELSERGFFACPASSISQSVLDVLDGGEQALLARQRKYGIRK